MHTRSSLLLLPTVFLLTLSGCNPTTTKLEESTEAVDKGGSPKVISSSSQTSTPTPPVHAETPGSSDNLPPGHPPLDETQRPKSSASPGITGVVLEQIPAGKYLYLKLKTPAAEVWAAVLKEEVSAGSTVTVEKPHRMAKFKSPTLGRTFDVIYFGTLAPNQPMEDTSTRNKPSREKNERPSALMPKAEGANSLHIDQLYAERTKWAGKEVAIRGMVVKYNAEILGSNWLHIQDGSGSAKAANNDLVVTTQAQVSVGDDVVVTGIVALDRDFGSGYSYGLMLERASVAPSKP